MIDRATRRDAVGISGKHTRNTYASLAFRACERARSLASGVRDRRHRVDRQTAVNGRPRSPVARRGMDGERVRRGRMIFHRVGRRRRFLMQGCRRAASTRTSSGEPQGKTAGLRLDLSLVRLSSSGAPHACDKA